MNVFKRLKSSSYVLASLVSKDFKLRYRRSVLGVLWSVLNPLLTMIVLSAVFSQMFRFDVPYYPVYFILGQTLFTLMSESTTDAMSSIITSAPLIKKIKIEKMIFPIEKVLFALVNYALSLVAVFCVMIFFQVPLTPLALLIPFVVLLTAVFSLGLSLLVSALATFFHDVIHLWGVLTTLWIYCTPIFYPVSILPDWMFQIIQFNPMYHFVTYIRSITIDGAFPGFTETAICIGFAVVTLVVGFVVFNKLQKKFILYI